MAKPVFLVTDNGSSFLARRFSAFLSEGDFQHVRIQHRTPQQLGLLERFHQTQKKKEVYWHLYSSPAEARESLEIFRKRYNTYRPHWALIPEEGGDPVTPYDVYALGRKTQIPRWQKWAQEAKKRLDTDLRQIGNELAKTGS
jgi:transposase InsO family protein